MSGNSGMTLATGGRSMTTAPALLLPATFHEYPSCMPVNPVVAHPYGMRTRWEFPTARRPCIRISVPLMVPADPHIARTGRCDSRLDDLPWRMDLHYDFLGIKRSNAHRQRKQRGRPKSTHIRSPFTEPTPTGRLCRRACYSTEHAEAINKNTLHCLKEWRGWRPTDAASCQRRWPEKNDGGFVNDL